MMRDSEIYSTGTRATLIEMYVATMRAREWSV